MKSWCDLSWAEKTDIEEGNVNEYSYLTGYDFNTKRKVAEGQEDRDGQTEN